MKLVNRYSPGSKQLQADLSGKFSNKQPRLFLLRHGQIQGYETRRFIGRTDVPLDETGRSQALFWKNALAWIQFDSIYTSTLSRCKDTAALICPGKKICTDERLNEINLGTWDNQSFGHIKAVMPEQFEQRGKQISQFRPPEGESFEDLYERISPFFKNLFQNRAAPVLVITHSGVIRVMLCHYLGLNQAQLLTIKSGYGDLFVLEKR